MKNVYAIYYPTEEEENNYIKNYYGALEINFQDVKNQVSEGPKYTVIGHLNVEPTFFEASKNEINMGVSKWVLNLAPNSTSTKNTALPYDPDVCKTNIPGIGIRYHNNIGYISCNSAGADLLEVTCPQVSGPYSSVISYNCLNNQTKIYTATRFFYGFFGELVLTGEDLPESGFYRLQLPIQLNAYWRGGTNPTSLKWGIISQNNVIHIVHNAPNILFPDYRAGNPLVNLNLTHGSFGSNKSLVTGKSSINICFYDGHDGNLKSFTVLMHDDNYNTSNDFFSVYHDNNHKGAGENRIDYDVSIINPVTNMSQRVTKNTPLVWTGTNDKSRQRRVNINGVSTWCSPSKVTLTTRPFINASKIAGNYSGILSVIISINPSIN